MVAGSRLAALTSGSFAVAALSCGALDVGLAMLGRAQSYEHLVLVWPPVFATMLGVLLALGGAWALVGRWLARRPAVDADALRLAFACGGATLFLLARVGRFSLLRGPSGDDLFLLGLYASGGLAVGVAAYFAHLGLAAAPRWRAALVTLLTAAPAVLLLTVAFLWAQLYGIEVLTSTPGLLVSLGYFAVLAWLCWRPWHAGARSRAAQRSLLAAVAALLLPVALAAADALRHWGASSDQPHAVRHVILLSADTLRADALSVYGNPRLATPTIATLARDGVTFEHADAVAPWTLPSLGSLVTGVTPAVHLVRQETDRLPLSLTTLAERFQAAGYYTAAVVDNEYLREKANFAQGFDDYLVFGVPDYGASCGAQLMIRLLPRVFRPERPVSIAEHTAAVQRWLRRHAERDFFLWVHYFDPHAPYEPPSDYVAGEPPAGFDYRYAPPPQIMNGMIQRSAAEQDWIHKLYEGEVRRLDDNLGMVLDTLRELGLYEDAVLVFTSDHGEEFWEHGGQGHGHTLHHEVVNVPLVLKVPGVTAGQRSAARVSAVRIAPTLLEAADVEYDPADFSAPSLLALARAPRVADDAPPVVSESSIAVDDQASVIFDERKFIESRITGRVQLYDLRSDPGEQANLDDGAGAAQGRQLLGEHEATASATRERIGVRATGGAEFDASTLARLRGLGYMR